MAVIIHLPTGSSSISRDSGNVLFGFRVCLETLKWDVRANLKDIMLCLWPRTSWWQTCCNTRVPGSTDQMETDSLSPTAHSPALLSDRMSPRGPEIVPSLELRVSWAQLRLTALLMNWWRIPSILFFFLLIFFSFQANIILSTWWLVNVSKLILWQEHIHKSTDSFLTNERG